MRPIHTYGQLSRDELKEELVQIMSGLAGGYKELSVAVIDQQREYLQAYIREPANSVAAKNRAAQYYTEELTKQIIELRTKINALSITRDLVILLLDLSVPDALPFPDLVALDSDGLASV